MNEHEAVIVLKNGKIINHSKIGKPDFEDGFLMFVDQNGCIIGIALDTIESFAWREMK